MIRNFFVVTLMVTALTACSDSAKESAYVRDMLSLFKQAVNRTRGELFDDERSHSENSSNNQGVPTDTQGVPTEIADKQIPAPHQLAQMMASMQADPKNIGEFANKEQLRIYRLDYSRAKNVEDKAEALATLVEADEKNAIPLLKEGFASREPRLRKEAVLQMQQFNDRNEVVEILLKALDDSDYDVAIEAVEGLAGLKSKRVRERLEKVAKSHPDKLIRAVAQDYVDQTE
jgi:HEAT repeat protein